MYSKKHIFFAVLITFVVTAFFSNVGHVVYNKTNEDILVRAKNMVLENYVDELTDEQKENLDDAALYAMVASLEDPYSYYFDMEDYEDFEESNEEEYIGIGVNVEYNASTEKLIVMSPTPGSPAEKAGLLPLDEIVGVDNITLKKNGYDAIIDHIKGGAEGDIVKLHILRANVEKTIDIRRSKIVTKTIFSKMLDDTIGYIKITKFQLNSVEDFADALSDLKSKNAKALIIDLRNNPGGYADSVIDMTDMLLSEGTIAYLEDNKGNKEYFESDANCIDIPMAVLINEGTASAAELMAGSLKAYDKATIVGKKSYGKAVGQAPLMLTEDTAIYLTTARYYTPKGECIDKLGITPDIEKDLPKELAPRISELTIAEDPQLAAAFESVYKEVTK